MIKLPPVPTVVRDVPKRLPAVRDCALVGALSRVDSNVFSLRPQPLEGHPAAGPGALERPLVAVHALMALQVLVRLEALAARLIGADVALMSTEVLFALKCHVTVINLALK